MRTGVLRNIAVAGVSALLLTACAGRDDAGVGTVLTDTVSDGVMQTESPAESMEDDTKESTTERVAESTQESTEVAETVEGGDGMGNEYELLTDMCGDYDGDGITDEVYRIREYGMNESDYYVDLSSCGELYLGSNRTTPSAWTELTSCDFNDDGADELVFYTGFIGADNDGISTIYAYGFDGTGYVELTLEQKENGRDFLIERNLTRARMSCEAVDFSYTIWDTLTMMDMGYYFMQGTTVVNKSPRFMRLMEYDGRVALRYSYVFGDDRFGYFPVYEYVTYADGKSQSVMIPSEMHGDLEKINADLRELDKEHPDDDIQYEYELGDDELLYDVHQYIAESGVDFAYTLYKSMPWENNKFIIINPEISPYGEDECNDIMRLADEIKDKFEMNSVSIFNSYIEDVGRFSEAKANRYGAVYALYNEETDAYDVFMEYDGFVLHNEGNGNSSYVINTNTGNRWPLNAALYATPDNEGGSVEAWLFDLNGDGEDEFIVKVTADDGNDLIFVENVKEHRDISPFYNIAQPKDKEAENISYIAAFDYVYGKEIYETVNAFYKEAGIGTRLSIPREENQVIRFLKDSSYHCELTDDNRLRLMCETDELSVEAYFSFGGGDCTLDSVEVGAVGD